MRLPLQLIIPVLVLNGLVDWYICRAVGRRRPAWYKFAVWSSIALALFLVVIIILPKKSGDDSALTALMWSIFAYFSVYIPKYIFCIVDLVGKIPCIFRRQRIKVFRPAAVVLAGLAFLTTWWGTANRFNIDVRRVDFADAGVPAAFDGFRIVQISDMHTGSYGTDTAFIAKVVDRINEIKPDAVLFTGDIVNRHSTELEPFVGTLSRIEAPVYSVLGNHDYGDYYSWDSDSAKMADRRHLVDLQKRMGWRMLNNESVMLHRGGDSIAVIGVENIGDPPFPVYGDLDQAYPTPEDGVFKILMSHNPAHWNEDIKDSPDKNIALTLAGHTHAMQMSAFGMSPAAMRYSTWGGMYADADSTHRLYVNIGLGEVGFPARIGATPEITEITLRAK